MGEMRPDNFPEMTTQIAEPFSPVIDGQILTDQPGRLIARGELRPYTPLIYTVQTDEGEMFVNLIFPRRQDSSRSQISPSRWREMLQNVHPNSFEEVLAAYPPPCDNDLLSKCDCHQLAKDWLTDYTWLCPFRRMVQSDSIRSSNPIYPLMVYSTLPHGYWKTPVRIFRSCIEKASCHCSDSILYFGMARERWIDDPEQLDDETEVYIDRLQTAVGNFIRTGNPNDYTGSPSHIAENEHIWTIQETNMFNYFGVNGQWSDVPQAQQCEMFDSIDEYFQH